MSIAPFGTRPVSAQTERRRARLAMAIATLGIAATLLAYAVSPGVRHAVGHAAHSVRHAVGRMLDRDAGHRARPEHTITTRQPARASRPTPGARRATARHGSGAGSTARGSRGSAIGSAPARTAR